MSEEDEDWCIHELKRSDCADCNGDAKKLEADVRLAAYDRIDSAFYNGGVTGGVFGGG